MSGIIALLALNSGTAFPSVFDQDHAITISFSQELDFVSIRALDVGEAGARMDVFDTAGNLLTSDTLEGTDAGEGHFGDLSAAIFGMRSIALYQPFPNPDDHDGVSFDNLSFNPVSVDTDKDGIVDAEDNCIAVANADQRDTDGDNIGNSCDADLTGDCSVNFGDLAALKAAFFPNPYNADADFNGDSLVNFGDLAAMKSRFFNGNNPGPGPSGLPNDCDGN